MRLLTAILSLGLLSSLTTPAFSMHTSGVEGLDQMTFDRNTEILREGRFERDFQMNTNSIECDPYFDDNECEGYVMCEDGRFFQDSEDCEDYPYYPEPECATEEICECEASPDWSGDPEECIDYPEEPKVIQGAF